MKRLLCVLTIFMLSFNGAIAEASGRGDFSQGGGKSQHRKEGTSSRTSTSRKKAQSTKGKRKNKMRQKADERFQQEWKGSAD